MSGKSFGVTPGFEDQITFIGDYKNPLWMGKAADIEQELLTEEFHTVFQAWRMHNAGFGLPGGEPWDRQDPVLMDALLSMEEYYMANWDSVANIRDILYTKIKPALFAGFRLKER